MERKPYTECHPLPKLLGQNFAIFFQGNVRILSTLFAELIWVPRCLLDSSLSCALELDWVQILSPLLHSCMTLNMVSDFSGLRVVLCKMEVSVVPHLLGFL